MKYQFIQQHKQKFPVVVLCRVLGVSESGFYACASALPASRNEKMLNSPKRFGRGLALIKADREVRVCTSSCTIRGSAAHASG
jgi:hypothetical protein